MEQQVHAETECQQNDAQGDGQNELAFIIFQSHGSCHCACKPLGIAGFTWLTVKLGWADLPNGLNMNHILGVGLLGGIGFTMSIFIADLGFAGFSDDLLMAKTGIIMASAVAGFGGFFWLMLHTREAVAKPG